MHDYACVWADGNVKHSNYNRWTIQAEQSVASHNFLREDRRRAGEDSEWWRAITLMNTNEGKNRIAH